MIRIVYEDNTLVEFDRCDEKLFKQEKLGYIFTYHEEEIYFFSSDQNQDITNSKNWPNDLNKHLAGVNSTRTGTSFCQGKVVGKLNSERLCLLQKTDDSEDSFTIYSQNKDRTTSPIIKLVFEDVKKVDNMREQISKWIKKRNFVMKISKPLALDLNDLNSGSLTSSYENMSKQDYSGLIMIL